MKLDISNFVCRLSAKSTGITHLKILEISANISKTVQDRRTVIMDKANRKSRVLSNGTNIDDLEWP